MAAGWIAIVPAAHGQNRGVYPLGLSAINSGVTAAAGFSYSNSFLFYGRDESKGASGQVIATGAQSVLMDMNGFSWVSDRPLALLGGAILAAGVTVPIANNSLSSSELGTISGGGGLADTYLQPLILGWRRERVDIRATLGALGDTRQAGRTTSQRPLVADAAGARPFTPANARRRFASRCRISCATARHGDPARPDLRSGLLFDARSACLP